ncbi:MAG: RNA polymerase sigma factor [Gaiellaceae bacterium]
MTTERSDAELIRAAAADAAAFGELYERHVRSVFRWFERRLTWAAADLTAETFARAWLRRRRFRDERDSALPWLLGIAANVLRESARRNRLETSARERLGLPTDLVSEPGFSAVEDRLSPREELGRALAELSDGQRRALELRVLDELSFGEIGRRLSIRPAAARLRVSRALRRLAVDMKEEL